MTDPDYTDAETGATLVEAGDDDAGSRLDRFLADRLAPLSRARIAALIRDGHVETNGGPPSPSHKVKAGERYRVTVPPPEDAEPLPEAIPLDIVYEDDALIVIDKPAGLVVHPGAGHESGTLVNALLAHCGDSLSGIGGVRRPGIVHRLDKDTSGLMVIAKTDAAHRSLAAQFADHGRTGPLERAYLALVWGAPPRTRGTIDKPIGRHRTDRTRQAVVREGEGRRAVTHYEVIGYGRDTVSHTGVHISDNPLVSLVRCRLETGRTHQIRVHMADIGAPVIGDPLYGTGFRTKAERLQEAARAAVNGLKRQALHAAELGFEHPVSGEALLFSSDLPTDLSRLCVELNIKRT